MLNIPRLVTICFLCFLLFLAASLAHGQSVGDLVLTKKASSGFTPVYLTPVNNKLVGFDGSGNPVTITANAVLVGLGNVANVDATNASNIATGTLNAGRLPDLSGTYQPLITAGTTGQYWRGDKTWQSLAAVATTGAFSSLTGTPTTLAGYGITDIPSQASHSGQYLTTNGSVMSWATVTGGATLGSNTFTGEQIIAPTGTGTRLDVQTSSGTSLFKVDDIGQTYANGVPATYSTGGVLVVGGGGAMMLGWGANFAGWLFPGGSVSGSYAYGGGSFYTDGTGNICMRGFYSPTQSQDLTIYNTYTSSTNYERAEVGWNTTTNVFVIGTQKGSGGGTARNIVIQAASGAYILLPSLPTSASGLPTGALWNNSGVLSIAP